MWLGFLKKLYRLPEEVQQARQSFDQKMVHTKNIFYLRYYKNELERKSRIFQRLSREYLDIIKALAEKGSPEGLNIYIKFLAQAKKLSYNKRTQFYNALMIRQIKDGRKDILTAYLDSISTGFLAFRDQKRNERETLVSNVLHFLRGTWNSALCHLLLEHALESPNFLDEYLGVVKKHVPDVLDLKGVHRINLKN